MPSQGKITANTPWSAGYNSVWGDGPPYPEHLYVSALNQEIAGFPTGDAIRDLGSAPFTLDADENICIHPRQLNNQEKSAFSRAGNSSTQSVYNRLKLMSGAACTYPAGLTPPYGFKMVAKCPTRQGTWPAFWAIPTDGSWPPELDTVEILNANGHNVQNTTSIHTKDGSWPNKARALNPPPTYVGGDSATQNMVVPGDLETAFHEYMSIVYSDYIATLFDNKIVWVWPTPSDFNKSMHLMFNMAVGGAGDWAGTPPNPNADLGTMVIKAIEIWQFPAQYGQGSQPIPPDPGPDPSPDPKPTNVAISVDGPDDITVTLTVNGQKQQPTRTLGVSWLQSWLGYLFSWLRSLWHITQFTTKGGGSLRVFPTAKGTPTTFLFAGKEKPPAFTGGLYSVHH